MYASSATEVASIGDQRRMDLKHPNVVVLTWYILCKMQHFIDAYLDKSESPEGGNAKITGVNLAHNHDLVEPEHISMNRRLDDKERQMVKSFHDQSMSVPDIVKVMKAEGKSVTKVDLYNILARESQKETLGDFFYDHSDSILNKARYQNG